MHGGALLRAVHPLHMVRCMLSCPSSGCIEHEKEEFILRAKQQSLLRSLLFTFFPREYQSSISSARDLVVSQAKPLLFMTEEDLNVQLGK
jgi:hypothetical protein